MKFKTYNILILILISSCTSQSITILSSIPPPLVKKNENISVITVYEDEVKNYLFESTPIETTDYTWDIDFQDAQKKIFNTIFDSFFSISIERESFDLLNNDEADIIMSVDLDKFEYLTPQLASNDKFSIWFKYKIKLYDSKLDLIQNWDITGYGEQESGSFDNNQSMANAINIALRDVGANLTIKLEKEKNDLLDLVK
tara:strand:+ start:1716 stop:2312 length:597 start_codon:yes stop_codon:yes gene_type:complete